LDFAGSAAQLKAAAGLSLFLCFISISVFAEPYLALREGLKCSSCHLNLTGGGKRTRMGAGYGAQDLPWKSIDLAANKIPFYWSFLDDHLSLGGDFRVSNLSTFSENDISANTFQTEKSNLYVQADLIHDFLSFYLDETVAPGGAQTREIVALFRGLPAKGWAKAGKLVLPYGLRIEDDRAFIREVTGFNFSNSDIGAEVGFEPGDWQMMLSLTNGTSGSLDNNKSKEVVGSAGYVRNSFRVGVSGSYNSTSGADRKTGGVWGGIHYGPVVLLGEADLIRDTEGDEEREQIATLAEIDYKLAQGWNLKAAYEYHDPSRDIDENERDRILLGIEAFLTPFLEVQAFYRFNKSIPQNTPQNADDLTLRLHIYF
jgi:hypothetical protein